jgi:hypothetical protein
MRRLAPLALVATLIFTGAPSRATDGVTFTVSGDEMTLTNGVVTRTWWTPTLLLGRRVLLQDFVDEATGSNWTISGSAIFRLGIGARPTDSDAWVLRSAGTQALSDGLAVHFLFEPGTAAGLPAGITLERVETLHDGSSVVEVTMTLHNDSPAPLTLSSFALDQFESWSGLAAEVQRYVGGSDWRDDFRAMRTETGPFDDEGEVARYDDGSGNGFFFVTERRGGAASRVGRDQSVWAGADYARDLLDLGPLATDPPDYNRVENPAYPVPVRSRRIEPMADFLLGRVATGVYHGGAEHAAAAYVSYLTKHRQPAFPRQVLLNSFHPWGHGTTFTQATMQAQADVAAQLGIDTIILDDQWQGGPGGESGDWNWDNSTTDGDPARFPDPHGLVQYFADRGIKLGLWMSPAEFHAESITFREHPNWACTPIGTVSSQVPDDAGLGVWDFTNSQFRAYITGVVDRLVQDYSVRYFKFDFQVWVDCPPHDYNDYEDAFVAWVDQLVTAHPNVTFTFDETNDQRMYAFESVARGPSWFDNGHNHDFAPNQRVTPPAQLLHDVWMAAPWVPPSTLGAGTYDKGVLANGYTVSYLMPIACLTHMTFWTDLTTIGSVDHPVTASWLAWYHQNAAALGGLVYRLTEDDPWDGAAPAAFQPWDPVADSGYLFAFRQSGAAPLARFQGLRPGGSYTLTAQPGGALVGSFTAAQLESGFAVPLSSPYAAAVYRVIPA